MHLLFLFGRFTDENIAGNVCLSRIQTLSVVFHKITSWIVLVLKCTYSIGRISNRLQFFVNNLDIWKKVISIHSECNISPSLQCEPIQCSICTWYVLILITKAWKENSKLLKDTFKLNNYKYAAIVKEHHQFYLFTTNKLPFGVQNQTNYFRMFLMLYISCVFYTGNIANWMEVSISCIQSVYVELVWFPNECGCFMPTIKKNLCSVSHHCKREHMFGLSEVLSIIVLRKCWNL